MISVLWIIACSSKPYAFKKKHPCRIESFSSESNTNGVQEIEERTYNWGEGRVDYQGALSEGYILYNEYGFSTESYQLDHDGNKYLYLWEYDCTEEWCWRTKQVTEFEREGETFSGEFRYKWDDKTEHLILPDGGESYTVYNDYAEITEWYYEDENGYQNNFYEYDCDEERNWCKLVSRRLTGSGGLAMDDEIPRGLPNSLMELRDLVIDIFEDTPETSNLIEDYLEYTWTGNRQDWEGESGKGHTIYNDYGYKTELYSTSLNGEKSEVYVWDCEE